jgi:hypothetical protein
VDGSTIIPFSSGAGTFLFNFTAAVTSTGSGPVSLGFGNYAESYTLGSPSGSVAGPIAFKMPRNGSLVSLVGQVTLTTAVSGSATGTTVTLTVFRAPDGSGVYTPLATALGAPVTVSIVIPTQTGLVAGSAFTETTPFIITPSAIAGGIPLLLGDNLAIIAVSSTVSSFIAGTIDAGIGIM